MIRFALLSVPASPTTPGFGFCCWVIIILRLILSTCLLHPLTLAFSHSILLSHSLLTFGTFFTLYLLLGPFLLSFLRLRCISPFAFSRLPRFFSPLYCLHPLPFYPLLSYSLLSHLSHLYITYLALIYLYYDHGPISGSLSSFQYRLPPYPNLHLSSLLTSLS